MQAETPPNMAKQDAGVQGNFDVKLLKKGASTPAEVEAAPRPEVEDELHGETEPMEVDDEMMKKMMRAELELMREGIRKFLKEYAVKEAAEMEKNFDHLVTLSGDELIQVMGVRATFMAGLDFDNRVDYEMIRMKPCEWAMQVLMRDVSATQ